MIEKSSDVFEMDAHEVENLCQKAVRDRTGVAQMPYTTLKDSVTGAIYKQYADGRKETI